MCLPTLKFVLAPLYTLLIALAYVTSASPLQNLKSLEKVKNSNFTFFIQLLLDFVHETLYRGFAPIDPTIGDFCPQIP